MNTRSIKRRADTPLLDWIQMNIDSLNLRNRGAGLRVRAITLPVRAYAEFKELCRATPALRSALMAADDTRAREPGALVVNCSPDLPEDELWLTV